MSSASTDDDRYVGQAVRTLEGRAPLIGAAHYTCPSSEHLAQLAA